MLILLFYVLKRCFLGSLWVDRPSLSVRFRSGQFKTKQWCIELRSQGLLGIFKKLKKIPRSPRERSHQGPVNSGLGLRLNYEALRFIKLEDWALSSCSKQEQDGGKCECFYEEFGVIIFDRVYQLLSQLRFSVSGNVFC